MNPVLKFLVSNPGRLLRAAFGFGLMLVGYFVIHAELPGSIVMVIGAVPLLAGLADVCLVAPLFGAPISGKRIRAGGRGSTPSAPQ